jgi:hypothetical protein
LHCKIKTAVQKIKQKTLIAIMLLKNICIDLERTEEENLAMEILNCPDLLKTMERI